MAPHVMEDTEFPGASMEKATASLWKSILREAQGMVQEHSPGIQDNAGAQMLRHFISDTVLKWNSLEECLAAHLSEKLGWKVVPSELWFSVLLKAFKEGRSAKGESIRTLARKDLIVIKERDPACPSFVHSLLYYKGYQGLQAYRAANWLWRNDQKSLAYIFQSRMSEVFGMDIHPAAQIGWGILMDHGTGVVIGETAVIGNGCTLLHGVTLGGTGKQGGDRHPKLGNDVLIGAGASILGNVKIGDCAKIGAAAVVLTSIPPFATAVGCPAKVIGRVKEENPAECMDTNCREVKIFSEGKRPFCPFRKLDCTQKGFLGPNEFAIRLREICKFQISTCQASEAFFRMDTDGDGKVTEKEFEDNIHFLYEAMQSTCKESESQDTVIRVEIQDTGRHVEPQEAIVRAELQGMTISA